MTVWLLTSGCYSDYGVVGIFSTEAKALEVKAQRADSDDNDLEPYEVDAMVGWEKGPTYDVRIIKESGEIEIQPPRYQGRIQWRHPDRCNIGDYGEQIAVTSPVSVEHAEKVAIEQRQAWLRSRNITEPSP